MRDPAGVREDKKVEASPGRTCPRKNLYWRGPAAGRPGRGTSGEPRGEGVVRWAGGRASLPLVSGERDREEAEEQPGVLR